MICKHAASGCNYPEGECAGLCQPVTFAEDDPILWPFALWLLTVFGGVAAGLLVGYMAWGTW